MSTWCLVPSYLFYLLASLGYLAFSFGFSLRLAGRSEIWVPRLAHTFTLLGFALQLFYLVYLYTVAGEGDLFLFLSLGMVSLFLILLWQHRWEGIGSFFIPFAFFLYLFSSGSEVSLSQHPWLIFFHIVFAATTLLLMLGSALLGLVFLIHERKLKTKQWDRLSQSLPPLFANEKVILTWLRWGWVALTLVLLSGALLVSRTALPFPGSWLHILLAVGTWGFYLTVLARYHRGWHGRRILFISFLGLASLLGVYLWS